MSLFDVVEDRYFLVYDFAYVAEFKIVRIEDATFLGPVSSAWKALQLTLLDQFHQIIEGVFCFYSPPSRKFLDQVTSQLSLKGCSVHRSKAEKPQRFPWPECIQCLACLCV